MPHKDAEKRRAWRARYLANLSPEMKDRISEQTRRSKKKHRVNMTPEQRQREREGNDRRFKKWLAEPGNIERKREHGRRAAAKYAAKPGKREQLAQRRREYRATWGSDKEQQIYKQRKRREASDPEMKERRREQINRGTRNYRKNLAPEKKQAFSEARHDYRRTYKLKPYGLTRDQFDAMFASQNGCCAICKDGNAGKNHKGKGSKELHVDHCHRTLKIRGLLCSRCNLGLGLFQDNSKLLRSAIAYLKRCG